jgi:hypothetical protein
VHAEELEALQQEHAGEIQAARDEQKVAIAHALEAAQGGSEPTV